jgi:hypothetical protein
MNSTSPRPAEQARTIQAAHRRTRVVAAGGAMQCVPDDHDALDGPRSDEFLVVMLRSIDEHDAAAEQLDSATLGRCLGWTAARTATSLEEAKARLLIWGIRVGGSPAPCFEDIELTVQGRRLLRAAAG